MLAEIGLAALTFAFLSAVFAVFAAVWGARQKADQWVVAGRNAALATFPLLCIAVACLFAALLTQQYQIQYVWRVSNPDTPLFYRATALWGGQKGSILFWSLLMSGFAFAAILTNWRPYRRLMPGVIAYTMATLGFFVGLSLFLENPFTRYWLDPTSGQIFESLLIPPGVIAPPAATLAEQAQGLDPLLRHFGMIIHPPMLYLGFVGFVIPFAFAMAALASGDLSTGWIKATRRWSLVAWLFLSLGLMLGGRWAYDVLGWGGYWGWDPVENAALLPWLIGTAFIHSVMIQEKRGMLKVWNLFLVIGTFSAVLFATFATRSGLIDSVHAFARSPIGTPMFIFWAAMTVISVWLILKRRAEGRLRDEHRFTSVLSRETMFVLNNIVFVALTLAVFWGSFGAPIILETLLNTEVTIGTEYYYLVTPPLFIAMYLLMGVAPLTAYGVTSGRKLSQSLTVPLGLTLFTLAAAWILGTRDGGALLGYGVVILAGYVALYEVYRGAAARRRTHGESWLGAAWALFTRNRRRYGGYLVHVGIVVIGIGVIGSTLYQAKTERLLFPGQSMSLRDYTVTYDGIEMGFAEDNRAMTIARVSISRNGTYITELRPRLDNFDGRLMTIAGSYPTLENDVYVLLNEYRDDIGAARLWLYINPLVNLIWWGGLILIVGTMVSGWPNETAPAKSQFMTYERSKLPVR